MNINIKKKSGNSHVGLEGELTIYNASQVMEALIPAVNDCKKMEISLAKVSEIDASGLQLLALIKREAAIKEKELIFFEHSQAVLEVLDLCDLAGVFGDPLVISSPQA